MTPGNAPEDVELLACEAPAAERSGDPRGACRGRRAAALSAALFGVSAFALLCASVLRGSHGQPTSGGSASASRGAIAGAATGTADAAVQLWGNDMHSCGEQTCDCSWVHSSAVCNGGAYATVCGRCCCDREVVKVVYVQDPEDYTGVIVLGVLVAGLAVFMCWWFCCRKAPAAAKPPPPPAPTPKDERGCWLASCVGCGDGCAGCPRCQCTPGECTRGPSCTAPSCTMPSCTMPRCSPPSCTTPAISCVFPK